MVEERRKVVANAENASNAGTPYPVEKVKRKWFDYAPPLNFQNAHF